GVGRAGGRRGAGRAGRRSEKATARHVPLGMSLQAGTRVIIDNGQPLTGPYVICLANGCVAEYEASAELITKMKTGQSMHVQGINGSGQPISIPMPLADFAKAYDGPPIDPKELEQQQPK